MHLLAFFSCGLLFLGATQALQAQASIRQIFEYPDSTFIENIYLRPNGRLLLSTFASGELFTLDPTAAAPSPRTVANLTGSTGLTGMAMVGPNMFAVSGGVHSEFVFARGSMQVYVVLVLENSDWGLVLDSISLPDTQMLNGMAALPATPHVVLSADSLGGRIFRIDTRTRVVSVAFADPLLGPGNSSVPLGANGIRIFQGYLYFTNSGRGTFGRIKINEDGSQAGEIEVLASLDSPVGMTNAYDDFAFDCSGNAYVALHSYSIVKITPEGTQTTFAGGANNTFFKEPTSAALSGDGKHIYVSTGGSNIDGTEYGGQIIEVALPLSASGSGSCSCLPF